VLDYRRPGYVELAGRGGRAPAGDPVRLLDERDADPLRERRLLCGDEVSRLNPARGAVTEDEGASRPVGVMHVGDGTTVRRVHFEHRHGRDTRIHGASYAEAGGD
jgi:hypothetical protein